MRKITIILLSLLGVITVFVAILAFILGTNNNQDYRRLLIKSVAHLSDYNLSITGTFNFNASSTPTLSASGIELHSKINNRRVVIDHFKIQIDLRPLADGTLLIKDLLVENMEIHLAADKKDKKDRYLLELLPFPVIENAVFNNVRVITEDRTSHELTGLLITTPKKDDPLTIHGAGQVRGHPFTIEGQLGLLADIFKTNQLFPIDLKVEWAHALLSINGTIKNPSHGEGLDLDVNFNVPEISVLFDSELPVAGHLYGNGRVTGALDEPELTEFHSVLEHNNTLYIEVTGAVGNLLTQDETALRLSGFINEPKLLSRIVPKQSPVFNKLNFKAELGKTGDAYLLDNVDINLSGPEGLDILLHGQTQVIFDQQPFRSMDIQVDITSLHTGTVKRYLGNILPEMGPVKGTAQITTQERGFVLSNIDLLVGRGQKTQLTAKGSVGPLSTDPNVENSNILLDLALNAKRSSELAALLDIEYPEIGPVDILAHLTGSAQEIRLEDVQLQAGFPDILSIRADGKMKWDQMDTDHPVQHADFNLHGSSPSFREAFSLYGENMPDLGPAEASMRVHGTGMVLTGTNLEIQAGTKNTMLYKAHGKVAQIYLDNFYNKGIELSATVEGQNTNSLSWLFENQKIPDFGPINGDFNIRGDSIALSIPQLTLTVGQKNGLILSASGKINRIPLKKQTLPDGVRIKFEAAAPNSADLSSLVGRKLPDLEPLTVYGLLEDHDSIFAVRDLSILAGNPKQADFSAKGTIEDLFSRKGIKMNILFGENTLIKLLDLHAVPELGRIKGSLLLSDADGSLGIEEIKIETENKELIDLKIIGAVDDLLEANEINVNAKFSVHNMTLLGKLFDTELPDLGTISGSGNLRGADEQAAYKGKINIGKTRLESDLSLSLVNSQPSISGTISSENIYLRDFGIHPDTSSAKVTKQNKKALFRRTILPLEALKKINLDLKTRFNKVTGIEYNLDKINIDLSLQNGYLKITPAEFIFSEGHIVMDAEVDVRRTIPRFTLKINGKNIQLGNLISEIHQPPAIEGNLDLIIGLNSQGSSAHDIASNLNGEFGLILERGKIRKREMALLFLNPLGWLFSYGINDNEVKISCGLSRYRLTQGIAKSEVLYLDGPKLMARGKGEINLANETIDLLINLEKKKLLYNTNVPIQVQGSLANPIFSQAPIDSPLLKADRYLFSPAVAIPEELLGTLWSFVDKKESTDHPCQGIIAR